jgi:predicted PurR-regulated permease PerM
VSNFARSPNWQRALIILSAVTVTVATIVALYWAQKVLIPVALAVFVAFLLSPVVARLRRYGVPRVPAVFLVVTLTVAAALGVGWLITVQIRELALGMPQYTQNIKERVRAIRDLGQDSVLDQLNQMALDVSKAWNEDDAAKRDKQTGESGPPVKVQVESGEPWIVHLLPTVPIALEILASAALVLVLAVFMLLKREDLRNRVIWVTGRGRVALTTKALDDIGHRISRFLFTQLIINGGYGVAVAAGLLVIGVEHWLLWGFLGGLLRYLPYIGSPVAALFPIALSLVQFEGWTYPLLVVGWIVLLEVLTANVLEPLLFGKSIGVSEVALLVAAGFWTFMWGPVGLVLSGPLTVCLVVVGKYVPALNFLTVLLGDEPALAPDISLFQRLAAGDQDEALSIVLTHRQEHGSDRVYDDLLLPCLAHLRTALAEDELSETDERFALDTLRAIVDDLGAPPPAAGADVAALKPAAPRPRVLCCPARDELDQLSLVMLQQLLDPARWEVEVVATTFLAGELVTRLEERPPAVLVIGSLPPGGLAHTRYLCKRIRGRFADLKVIVGRWIEASAVEPARDPLRETGADKIDATLLQVRDQLLAWLPVLQAQEGANGKVTDTGITVSQAARADANKK